jgi:hypothetical protein
MRKRTISIFIALVILALVALPAQAITGGQPDKNGHPYGALILVPGWSFCSGTLIDEDVVLTAAHCTSYFAGVLADPNSPGVWVSFDPYAKVDTNSWEITGGTWYAVKDVVSHPDYVDANWPYTADYGLVLLKKAVKGIKPAALPEAYALDAMIGNTGQTEYRFNDVGYGQNGVSFEYKTLYPYLGNFDFVRKFSIQRYNPSVGAVGTQDPMWLMLQNVPSEKFGSGCGGDSGSGIYPVSESTVVAVHTGGYRIGWMGQLCGRMTSLNHRVDLPIVLDWIAGYLD